MPRDTEQRPSEPLNPEQPSSDEQTGSPHAAPRLAVAWLRAALADGAEHSAGELTERAEAEGITSRALRSAREVICEPPVQRDRQWWWRLRDEESEQAPQAQADGSPWPVHGAPPWLRDGWIPRGLGWLDELADEHRQKLVAWGAAVKAIGEYAAEATRRERARVEVAKTAILNGGQAPPTADAATEIAQIELLQERAEQTHADACAFVVRALAIMRERRDELEGVDFTRHAELRESLRSAPGGWEADRREALRRQINALDEASRPDIEDLSGEVKPGDFDPGAPDPGEAITIA